MSEDHDRSRMDNSPRNLAILCPKALNVLRKATSKGSLRGNTNLRKE
jgi:predicted transposase YbfD/YdcC